MIFPQNSPHLSMLKQIRKYLMIEKIVSGGQTGVDQAALFTASEMGLSIGGWCPKGGLDANGVNVLNTYPTLKQATTSDPNERTKLNIDDSDGTLIIVPSWPLPESIKDGTRLTIEYAKQQNKPSLIISLSERKESIATILHWVRDHNITILNIGGPRESNWPGIHNEACGLFRELFIALLSSARPKL